jgi:4-hydroxyacetophenone monooxygenase
MNESLTEYIFDAVRFLLQTGTNAVDVREHVYSAYNDRVDSVGALRTWEWSSVSSWYKNSKGRSAQNYPFSALELVQRSASIDQTDFIVS